jgi:hypothetical protein
VNNTQPDPLTWIIYQGNLSSRFPTTPTHSSTKHVPISPTYHHKICVSTIYQSMIQTINLYHTKHQTCSTTYITTNASTVHQHLYQTMHQPCTNTLPYASTMYINNVHQHHTMYQSCNIACANHVHQSCTSTPYHVSILHHTMCQYCTIPCTILCTNHAHQP